MSKGRFSHFEDRLERLVEGSFARLFRGPLHPREVALQLARAIEDHTTVNDEGREVAPNFYRIRLHPDDHATLLAQTPDLAQQLAQHVVSYCLEAELELPWHPQVILVDDDAIERRQLRAEAMHITTTHTRTEIMARVSISTPPPTQVEAQLIVDGKHTIPLDREIFNVGRRPDNDLVLGDPAISRHHLQIRLRHGRYVLYDTQSRSGTYINGQLVKEHILAPGDVIRIGKTSLLYLEEEQSDWTGDTQIDLTPSSPPA